MPGLGADGAVERGVRQGERLVGFGVRGQGLLPAPRPAAGGGSGEVRGLQAVHRGAAAGGTAVLAVPGDGIGIEHAAGGEPDQDVDRAAEEPVGEGGGAVAGVEDEQRRGLRAVPGGAQAAQHVLHLRDRLRCAGRGRGARHVDERGPRGAQVPDRRGELVLPAGRGLGLEPLQWQAPLCTCSRPGEHHASGLGIGGRVDGEPQPGPPGARVPHLRGIVRRAARPAPCPAARDRSRRAPRSTRGPRGRPRPAAVPTPAGRTASRHRSARRPARHTARRGRG